MRVQAEFRDTLLHLRQLSQALDDISSNPYHGRINDDASLSALFEAILAFDYASNSKELRDTGDERVHALLNDVREASTAIYTFLIAKIVPESPAQQRAWRESAASDPGGKYAFRDDGAIEVSLLDSTLEGSTLDVGRFWGHLCNFDGTWSHFKLALNAAQLEHLEKKFNDLDAIRDCY